jgi:hypothetical protein
MSSRPRRDPASFRDPSGYVLWHEGQVLRVVSPTYAPDYDALVASGLLEALWSKGWLVAHTEEPGPIPGVEGAHRVLRPRRVPFLSYPYEWCFGQLQDAALLTLAIQKEALQRGLTLKDAAATNVQFVDGRPLFIDTLSFERLEPGRPWAAYRQFCQHFLAPLVLMSTVDARLGHLLAEYVDGIPLDLGARLAPLRTRLRPSLAIHLHLHARLQSSTSAADADRLARRRGIALRGLLGLVDSLSATVSALTWRPARTAWGDYAATADHYSAAAATHNAEVVARFLGLVRPDTVWDLGANTGAYSRLASQGGALTVAMDSDVAAVEASYRQCRREGETRLLPLVIDLTNPSAGLGWRNAERRALAARGPADLAMALALVHHLAIGNNLPFEEVAAFFGDVCRWLIIEYVPKGDPKVLEMLAGRRDVFDGYTQARFEEAFARRFAVKERAPIRETERVLYLMEAKD